MKKIILMFVISLVCSLGFATDANLMKYVEILPDQSATLEKTDLLLLGPSVVTNLMSVTGSVINVSSYEGYGLIVLGQGVRSGSGDTSTVAVVYGFDSSPATALITATQDTATAKFTSYEFDFDTLQGTNAALYLKATLTNVEGDDTAMVGDAVLIYDAARADQTITGVGVDISAYKGNATFLVDCGAPVNEAASYTNIVTIEHSSALGSGYSTVTNLAGTAGVVTLTGTTGSKQTFACDLGRLHKYVRATSLQKNDVGSVGVTLVAPMKSE